ncbi:MAG: transposase, partial [Planctomycetaceae bacterium]|nr:transposase [Planctomycetaceae bacterium]
AGAFWGALTGPNPTDRGKNGSKRHVACDGQGTPLAIIQTGAHVHDSQQAIPLIDAIPAIKRPGGGRRKRPKQAYADRAYDAEGKIRRPLRKRGIQPFIAKRNTEHGSGLESIGAWWKDCLPGCSSFADCASGTKNATTFTTRSSRLDACLSAGTELRGFVRVPKCALQIRRLKKASNAAPMVITTRDIACRGLKLQANIVDTIIEAATMNSMKRTRAVACCCVRTTKKAANTAVPPNTPLQKF